MLYVLYYVSLPFSHKFKIDEQCCMVKLKYNIKYN